MKNISSRSPNNDTLIRQKVLAMLRRVEQRATDLAKSGQGFRIEINGCGTSDMTCTVTVHEGPIV